MLTEVIDIYFLCGRFMLQLADQSKCLQINIFYRKLSQWDLFLKLV